MKKNVFVAFLWLFLCLGVAELFLRWHFSRSDIPRNHLVALIDEWDLAKRQIMMQRADEEFKRATGFDLKRSDLRLIEKKLHDELYQVSNRHMLLDLCNEYEANFRGLIQEANRLGLRVLVLYLPMFDQDPSRSPPNVTVGTTHASFFAGLARKYGTDYLDVTKALTSLSVKETTFYPLDMHLSERGHRIVAEALVKHLEAYAAYRSHVRFSDRPERLGDCPAGSSALQTWILQLPFRMVCNSQGLRMDRALSFPAKKFRVLVLGDSFAFGAYVENEQAFPNRLDRMNDDMEVINAAWMGYTILDELLLFQERAKYVEPDLIVLQVVDNDIEGLFAFMQNMFGRTWAIHGKRSAASPEEKKLLAKIVRQIRGEAGTESTP